MSEEELKQEIANAAKEAVEAIINGNGLADMMAERKAAEEENAETIEQLREMNRAK